MPFFVVALFTILKTAFAVIFAVDKVAFAVVIVVAQEPNWKCTFYRGLTKVFMKCWRFLLIIITVSTHSVAVRSNACTLSACDCVCEHDTYGDRDRERQPKRYIKFVVSLTFNHIASIDAIDNFIKLLCWRRRFGDADVRRAAFVQTTLDRLDNSEAARNASPVHAIGLFSHWHPTRPGWPLVSCSPIDFRCRFAGVFRRARYKCTSFTLLTISGQYLVIGARNK